MQFRLRLPAREFGTVYADPPWLLKTGGAKRKLHYDTMTTEEIMAIADRLNEPGVLRQDAHLWLWTTNPHLPEALDVVKAWGFKYKSMMTWDKKRIGIGWWLRSRTEHVLFCVRDTDVRSYRIQPGAISTLLDAPYRGHSVKPTEVYNIIESLSPGPYLELFAGPETELREGWVMLRSHLPPTGNPYKTGYTPDGQCEGCPHPRHPTEVCMIYAPYLGIGCPCSYNIEEEGSDLPEAKYDSGRPRHSVWLRR